MLAVAVLGFVSAVVFGASDFFGGLAARRMSPLLASALGAVVAVAGSGIAVAVTASPWPWLDVVLAVGAGVLGAIGTWTFYAALAVGPMSIISPGVAMIYAVIPAVVGIALGERFSWIGYLALGAVIVAALLLAIPRQRDATRLTPRAILLGLVAGFAYAGYLILMGRTSPRSGLTPLFVELATGLVIYAVVVAVNRLRRGPAELDGLRARGPVLTALLAGLLLVTGNTLLVLGLHLGDLAVMGVLNALYPLGTVVLAIPFLRERLSWVQGLGIALALAASAVLALD